MLHRLVASALVLVAALACDSRSSVPQNDSWTTPATTTYPCKVDEDCPGLNCGPCTPGVLITKDLLYGPTCNSNPCKTSQGVCGAQHLCVIGPKTVNDPATWGTAPSPGHAPNH